MLTIDKEIGGPDVSDEVRLAWPDTYFVQLVFRAEFSSPLAVESLGELQFRWVRSARSFAKVIRSYARQVGGRAALKDLARICSPRRVFYCVSDQQQLLHTGWISTYCRRYWIDHDACVVGPIWTSPLSRGRGIAQSALKNAINLTMRDLGRNIFFIDTSLDNFACLKVIDHCGFGRPFGAYVRGIRKQLQ